MDHETGKKEAVSEGLNFALSLGVYLGIAVFIALLLYVIQVMRRRIQPKFPVKLVLHVSNFDLCQDVTLWRGRKCPHFLRLPARNTPRGLSVRGCCFRPRLLVEVEDLVISESTTGCREGVPTSVPLSLFQAWKLRRILNSPRVYCHLEWRHGQAPRPVLMGGGPWDHGPLDSSVCLSDDSLQSLETGFQA